jgi:hypothetical protein
MKQTTQKLIISKAMRITPVFLLIISFFMFTGCSNDDYVLEPEILNKTGITKGSNTSKSNSTKTIYSLNELLVGQILVKIRQRDLGPSTLQNNTLDGYLNNFRKSFVKFLGDVTDYYGIYDDTTIDLVNVEFDNQLPLDTEYWLIDTLGTVRGLTDDDTIRNIENASLDCSGLDAINCFFSYANGNRGNGLGDDIPKNPSIELMFQFPM